MPRLLIVGGDKVGTAAERFGGHLASKGFDFDPSSDVIGPSKAINKDVTKYDGVIILKGMTGPNQPKQAKALCQQHGVPYAEVAYQWTRAWPAMRRVFGGTSAMPVPPAEAEEVTEDATKAPRPWEDPASWVRGDETVVDPVERTRQYVRMYFEDSPEKIVDLGGALGEVLEILEDRTADDVRPILEETAKAMQAEWFEFGGRGGGASPERTAFMELRWSWLKRHLLEHYDEHGEFPTQPPVIEAGRAIFGRPTSTTHISKAKREVEAEIAERASQPEPEPKKEKTVKAVIRPANVHTYRQMRQLWLACKAANVEMHADAKKYFGPHEPTDDPDGVKVLQTFEGVTELAVDKIPDGTTHIIVSE